MNNESPDTPTINTLIDKSCERFADLPALSFAFQEPLTYAQMRQRFMLCAAALKNKGVKRKDKIGILAENSPEWGCVYLAIVRLGAVAVPILPDFPETDVSHILSETGVKILFTTERQIDKLYEIKEHSLKIVITIDDYVSGSDFIKIRPLADFLAVEEDVKAMEIEDKVKANDIASIIYTSGTSGHSKAVMLTHANLCANVKSANLVCGSPDAATDETLIGPGWTFLSVLPISHTYEFTTGFLLPMINGARVVYCDRPPTPKILEKICQEEKPTVMCVVPMIMEKIYKKRILPALQGSLVIRLLLKITGLRRRIFNRISAKLLKFFGGELKLMAIGGAALNIEVEKFLAESNFPYIVGYGLTETAPLLAGGPFGDPTIVVGSCGKPVSDVEIRIADPDPESGFGEIMAKGPNVMLGYFNNQLATKESLDEEGWFATGDLGRLDEHNNLIITGRSKSVIVLSSGENIYPETIEEKINSFIEVSECLVAESNNKLVAIIYPDYEYIDEATKGKSQQQKLEYIEHFLRNIQRSLNQVLPSYSKISRVVERQEPFIKTATHKIKRYLYSDAH